MCRPFHDRAFAMVSVLQSDRLGQQDRGDHHADPAGGHICDPWTSRRRRRPGHRDRRGGPAGASASVILDGSFSTVIVKPDFAGRCPSVRDAECGTMQLAGLGAADWIYAFGPAFEPDGRCFDVDGTFTLTLQSDESTISGPLTGLFCPRESDTAHQHVATISYGGPFVEDDSIAFTDGTGQFAGLSGNASFHTFSAGARFTGTLTGTLTG
jgi:hypothetical protein